MPLQPKLPMRNTPLFRYCLAILLLCLYSCNQHAPAEKKSKLYNIARAMEREFLMAYDPFLNTVPTQRLLEAKEFRDSKLQTLQMNRIPVPGIFWEERGPQNVGGRTRALLFDLSDAANGYKKVWAGGVSGGLWRCNDITAVTPVWVKQDDLFDNLAVSSIIQDPSDFNIMYFGTGEGWFNIDAVQGAGIWKTTDGGTTWNRLSSTQSFFYVQDLSFDANGNLYATVRPTNSGGGNSGLMKSADGGLSWVSVLNTPVASNNRGADIELASNGDLYVSMGTNASNGGIYRSSFTVHGAATGNAGTWVNITPNTSGNITNPSSLWSRIELAVAPSDPDRVYALFQQFGTQDCSSIQQYNAATNTWTVRSVPNIIDQGSNSIFTRGQAFYNLIAAVDPNNEDVLYIGGIDALRSVNAGQNWTQMTSWSLFAATGFTADQQVHADHHAIVYAPGSSSRMLWGTDGGVYYTENGNITGTGNKPIFRSKNNGYNVTQYYSAAIHPVSANYFLGGTQDNGTHRFNAAGMNTVTEVTGGDGGFCFIDEDNPLHQITSYTYNNFHISTNGGSSFSSRSFNNFGQFINAADYASTENVLYAGHKAGFYFRWTTPHNAGTTTNDSVKVNEFGAGIVTHVKASAQTPNRVFFGLHNGSLVMVDDAHSGTLNSGTIIKTGTGTVSCVALDPNDENHMLVTYSNFGVNSVYESFNALSASPVWTSVEGDLPDMPVRWAMFDPRNSDWAILATELGVWSTNDLNGNSTEWSPTNSGLANVRVDMLRLRPTDQTILAATHGRGIFTAVIPTITTPDINFAASNSIATELSGSVEDCRSFQDFTFSMTIANPPSGDAEVALSVIAATATVGSDFDFTTNGDFTAPSNTLVFEDGDGSAKQITVRVYNDAEVEGAETVTFGYSLSGNSDAQQGIGNQEHILTIQDNDVLPVGSSDMVHTIAPGDLYTLGNNGDSPPFNARYSSKKSIFLYRAEEMLAAGAIAGELKSLALYLQKFSSRPYQNLQIRLGTTTFDHLIDGASVRVIPTATVFTTASYSTVEEWNTFNFNTPFEWDGEENIVVEICYSNAAADSAQLSDVVIGYSDGSTITQGNFYWQNSISCATGYSSVTYYNYGYKPMIQFAVESEGAVIATALDGRSEYFSASNDLHIYTATGELMARVRNLSTTQSYGCMEIAIDRAGIGAKPFWNNNDANQVMDKTLRIIPTSNFGDGSYEITLYYTPEEVAGWEAATGQSFNAIQLIKTKGKVSDITPNTPGAEGDVEIVTPVIGSLGPNRTLTYTFSTGFSGFAAGIVGSALPVQLMEFSARPVKNTVELQWKTASEQNSRGFDIEKSANGKQFASIGFVSSNGNSTTVKSYQFTDQYPWDNENYYRLRQVDIDGKVSYSEVVLVKLPKAPKIFRIAQNPVRSVIDIRFASAPNTSVEAQLIDLSGRVVMRWPVQQQQGHQLRLQLPSGRVTRGMYVLSVKMNGINYPERIIIE